jgi:hypothetical protein
MLWSVYMNGKDAGLLPYSSASDAEIGASKFRIISQIYDDAVFDVRPTNPEGVARYEEFMDEYNNWDPVEDV